MGSKPTNLRVVLDTNLLISRALTPSSLSASAVRLIIDQCDLLASQATMDEYVAILDKIQTKGYIEQDETLLLIKSYNAIVEWIPVMEKVQVCRDPDDDKFLDLAINGQADYIITGDRDLLVLHPFRDIQILSIKDFVPILITSFE